MNPFKLKPRDDAELDIMTAKECFEYLSRSMVGGQAAILKAITMTRAHERRKWTLVDAILEKSK